MSIQDPDITDEEIGMRSYRIRKGRAVERALERVRQALGTQWAQLSLNDIQALEWMYGEVWAHVSRDEWDRLAFSALRFSHVNKTLEIGQDVVAHKRTAGPAIEEVIEIVRGVS